MIAAFLEMWGLVLDNLGENWWFDSGIPDAEAWLVRRSLEWRIYDCGQS